MDEHSQSVRILKLREKSRDQYWEERDPINDVRLLWRAQIFRHLVHLLPGQTILELGCGKGFFTRQLVRVSRGENPITAVSFSPDESPEQPFFDQVEYLSIDSIPGPLSDRRFDLIVSIDHLDKRNCGWFLQRVYEFLNPGGQVVFFESNPWNPVLNIRKAVFRLLGKDDNRVLLSRSKIYELISEIGYLRIFSIYHDFLYSPLTPWLVWLLKNLSVVLENTPFFRTLAGSILIHAQRPPRKAIKPNVSLCEHQQLHHKVSVVVPCYNEEMNVTPLVSQLMSLYGQYLYEIILVEDNSQDGTRAVIRELTTKHPIIKSVIRSPPGGVGRALKDGYQAATGEYILSMDCDFQHLLPELRDLFDAAAEGYDMVVGSRFSQSSVLLNYPFTKIIANRGFHLLARLALGYRFRDLTNNLRLMRRHVMEKLELTQPSFAINAETGFQPLLMGHSFKEVPISWINRTPDMGASSFRLIKVGGGYWQVLWRLWFKYRFNKNRPLKS
ncbi:MAG: glycosyltransferase [Nitrospirales bacterium]